MPRGLHIVVVTAVLGWAALLLLARTPATRLALTVVGGLVGLAAAGALAVWNAAEPRDPPIDCRTYRFPAQTWRSVRLDRWPWPEATEARRRRLARDLVRCHLLVGRRPAEVVALLGRPDYRGIDGNPRRHRDWSYVVGRQASWFDDEDVTMHLEIDGGRVVFAEAPSGEVGEAGDEVRDGRLVGGGPRSE